MKISNHFLIIFLLSTTVVSANALVSNAGCPLNYTKCELKINNPDQTWGAFWTKITQSGSTTGNHELQDYKPEQVTTNHDGTVKITLQKTDDPIHPGGYISGKIVLNNAITNYAKTHGYYEIVVQLPQNIPSTNQSVRGLWPAVWMLPTENSSTLPWPMGGEFDLFELVEQKTTAEAPKVNETSLHFGPASGTSTWYFENGIQHWGYQIASSNFTYAQPQTIGFEWEKIGTANDSYWKVTMYLNKNKAWSKNFTRNTSVKNNFAGFETNKTFFTTVAFSSKADPSSFSANKAGDPVLIFNRGLDNKSGIDGYHV
ncbi:MAG TPA: hypothetical protein VKR58_01630, partial [Aquella sp.]|nr:hypothetical protein [Aquella sp.]